ncbi:MAG: hypothetical protein R3F47_06120 [Gammaproteobacteria bacterium]|jgi:hypothetical protein
MGQIALLRDRQPAPGCLAPTRAHANTGSTLPDRIAAAATTQSGPILVHTLFMLALSRLKKGAPFSYFRKIAPHWLNLPVN